MLKNKSFWIILGLTVLFVGAVQACISKYDAKQSQKYHECLQDYSGAGYTLEESREYCGVFLE